MIERHKGAYGTQQSGYGNSGMYAPPIPPMPTIQEMMMANHSPVANPFAAAPVDQYGMSGQQQPALVRVPSNGSAHGYSAPFNDYQQYPAHIQNMAMEDHANGGQGQEYANLERASVTPFQAAQYAEISRQLNTPSATNSPISPAFGQGFGAEQNLSVDPGRLPTPAPPRAISPQAVGPQRVMTPNISAYSFPIPLSNSPPAEIPASVAHAAARAALGVNANSPAKTANSPPRVALSHLHPQGQAQVEARAVSVYNEEDAYGGM